MNNRLGDPQGKSGRFGENCLVITKIQTPCRRVCNIATTPTELPRFNIRDFIKVKTLFSFFVYLATLSKAHITRVTASNSRMAYELGGVWNGDVEARSVEKDYGK